MLGSKLGSCSWSPEASTSKSSLDARSLKWLKWQAVTKGRNSPSYERTTCHRKRAGFVFFYEPQQKDDFFFALSVFSCNPEVTSSKSSLAMRSLKSRLGRDVRIRVKHACTTSKTKERVGKRKIKLDTKYKWFMNEDRE